MIPAGKPSLFRPYVGGYVRRYLARSFHTLHLLGTVPEIDLPSDTPLLVCMNHTSWWDVLLAFYLDERFLGWERYGVMDERQLKRYLFFRGLGMIGVDRTSLQGAREFLDYAEKLLKNQRRALWLTPQGEMVSPHQTPLRFQPGLAHLAERLERFTVLRIVLHYEFWDDKTPEVFVSFAPPEFIETNNNFSRRDFLRTQETAMASELRDLLETSQPRKASLFTPLLSGKSGISPTFDIFRSLSARIRGEKLPSEHSQVETPPWKQRPR